VIATKHRFHGHNSVSRVRGGAARSQMCSIFYAKSKKDKDYKMAVVVSKKISKHAVDRNRIRRRLYEIVRKSAVFDGVPIQTVFVVHTLSVATMPSQELEQIIAKLARQAIAKIS
jgi:ribonuclease P protein component